MRRSAAAFSRRRLLVGTAGATALAALPTACGTSRKPDPFTLGVASGDPTPDGVVLWTRLARDPAAADGLGGMGSTAVRVDWQVATDDRFRNVVRSGTTSAIEDAAHSVHVQLTGLRAGAVYYYRFRSGGHHSPPGRTRTAPDVGADAPLLLASVSCANWEQGLFTAYRHLAAENPDVIAALGDYIYEGASKPLGPGVFRSHAGGECHTLADYRRRYAQYKTDPDLQAAHAVAPWVVVPDDHEVSNNYAGLVPQVRDPGFAARRAAAYRAYWENMPLRPASVPTASGLSLYRRLAWGRLVTLHLLDTRQYRDDQACGGDAGPVCAGRLGDGRQMLGAAQEQWLRAGLAGSTAVWDVLAQQVLFATIDRDPGPGKVEQMDAWDGYPAARRRVLDMLAAGGAGGRRLNPVVLTGDEHRNYANDLYRDFDRVRGASPVGVELVATSISSSGNGRDADPATDQQLATNPHVRFANSQRGYVLTRFDAGSARADFRVVPYVDRPGAPISTRASFAVPADEVGLHRA